MHSPGPPPTTSPPPSASKNSKSDSALVHHVPTTSVATPPDSNSESHLSDHQSADEQDQQETGQEKYQQEEGYQEKSTPAERFVALISKYSTQGKLAPADCVFTISPTDFYEAQNALRQNRSLWNFFSSKVRYDYDAPLVTFRMPGDYHEHILGDVKMLISGYIQSWRQSDDENVRNLAFNINATESRSVDLSPSPEAKLSPSPDAKLLTKNQGRIIHDTFSPDGSWDFQGQTSFVLEVAISETKAAAEEKILNYITRGTGMKGGGIRTIFYIFGKVFPKADKEDSNHEGSADDEDRRLVTLDPYLIPPQAVLRENPYLPTESRVVYSVPPPAKGYGHLDLKISDFIPHHLLAELEPSLVSAAGKTQKIPLNFFYNPSRILPRAGKGLSSLGPIPLTIKHARSETPEPALATRSNATRPGGPYIPSVEDSEDEERPRRKKKVR